MNSIKNAIVTVTLLVVGYGSYVILKEPNPTPFVDQSPQNMAALESPQLNQQAMSVAPTVSVQSTPAQLEPPSNQQVPKLDVGATAWNNNPPSNNPPSNNSAQALAAPKLNPSNVALPVGNQMDSSKISPNASRTEGTLGQSNANGTSIQTPTLNPTAQQSRFQAPALQQPAQQPSNNSRFGNAVSNFSDQIKSAQETASQQLSDAKTSIASRFEQAQVATENAIQAVGENAKSLGAQAKQTLENNLSKTAAPSQNAPLQIQPQPRVEQPPTQFAPKTQQTQSPQPPKLAGAVGTPNLPKLTSNLVPPRSQQGEQFGKANPVQANPVQATFGPTPSRFGKLQAKEVVPDKSQIEPPVAALAEPNSEIKPPFASEFQTDNPFRKTITIDEREDQRPLVPRVDEWDPYVGPPLSATELAERNGTPSGSANMSGANMPAANSGYADPATNANGSDIRAEFQSSSSVESEATSIRVVEPGIVLPADATPMIASGQFESDDQALEPSLDNRFQVDTPVTSTSPVSNLATASTNFAADNATSGVPSPTTTNTNPFSSPIPNPVRTEPNTTTSNSTSSNTSLSNPVRSPAFDPAQAPIGNILPPPVAGNSTFDNAADARTETPPQPTSVSTSSPNYPTTENANVATSSPVNTGPTATGPTATGPNPAVSTAAVPTPSAGPQNSAGPQTLAPQEPLAPNATFDRIWGEVQDMLKNRDYTRALRTLTPWCSESNLNSDQNTRCIQLLDKLAGAIIYSRSSYLEPAYVVKAGETLDEIAALFSVPQELLAKINGIAPPYALSTGEKLKVIRGPFRASVSLSRQELTLFSGPNYAGRFKVRIGKDLPTESAFYEVAEKTPGRTYFDRKLGREVIQSESINIYGQRWLGLRGEHITAGHSVGIHSRAKDGSTNGGEGSISLSAKDAEDVSSILSVGSRVEVRP